MSSGDNDGGKYKEPFCQNCEALAKQVDFMKKQLQKNSSLFERLLAIMEKEELAIMKKEELAIMKKAKEEKR